MPGRVSSRIGGGQPDLACPPPGLGGMGDGLAGLLQECGEVLDLALRKRQTGPPFRGDLVVGRRVIWPYILGQCGGGQNGDCKGEDGSHGPGFLRLAMSWSIPIPAARS